MDYIIISAGIFFVSLIVIELILYSFRNLAATRRAKIKKRMRKYTFEEDSIGDIIKKRKLSNIPLLDKILTMMPIVSRLDRLILQSNASNSLSFYILLSFLLGAVGLLACHLYSGKLAVSIAAGVFSMTVPFFYLMDKRIKRVEKFRAQLHEALDLIARALRAGHSFTNAMKLAADEFDDPLGTEFEETLDEINFGVSVPDALRNMAKRIDCKEIQYFVVAVIIQRDTGGNLAELIESLAHIVRERFKFDGKVRILAAEGKVSAVILIVLPFLVGFWVWINTPKFLDPLFEEQIGHIMIAASAVMMVVGTLVIRSMVKIEV